MSDSKVDAAQADIISKVIADRIRVHAENIYIVWTTPPLQASDLPIDFYGDEFAEKLKSAFLDLAHSIENPERYDMDPVCLECGEECGGTCE